MGGFFSDEGGQPRRGCPIIRGCCSLAACGNGPFASLHTIPVQEPSAKLPYQINRLGDVASCPAAKASCLQVDEEVRRKMRQTTARMDYLP